MTRARLVDLIAREILALRPPRPAFVAIDGVDGAGKTTFADELAAVMAPAGRQVIRASVDGFHHPRAVRYARGPDSPEGFFLDSYDYAELQASLLDPLAAGGSRRFRRAAFDWRSDAPVHAPEEEAAEDAILLLDGIFLHRDELAARWDYSVFLHVSPAVSLARNEARGGRPSDRYVIGQRLYLAGCDPARRATVVIANDRARHPRVIRRSPGPPPGHHP